MISTFKKNVFLILLAALSGLWGACSTGAGDLLRITDPVQTTRTPDTTERPANRNSNDGPGHESEGGPQASIPAPTLQKCLAYNSDYNYSNGASNVPYVCAPNEDMAAYGDGQHFLVLSSEPIVPPAPVSELRAPTLFDRLFPNAYAQTGPNLGLDICDQPNTYCCPTPINRDGSAECYYPLANGSIQDLHVAVANANTVSPSARDRIFPRVMWYQNPPKGTTTVIGTSHSLTATSTNTGIEISFPANGAMTVQGNYQNQYSALPVNGDQVSFSGNLLASRRPTAGIEALPVNPAAGPGQLVTGAPFLITVPGAETYEKLKVANDGNTYFGIKSAAGASQPAYLYNPQNPLTQRIEFIEAGDAFHHSRTIAFDVDRNNCAMVLFEDTAGEIRLRGVCFDPANPGGSRTIISNPNPATLNPLAHDFVDLVIYRSTAQPGSIFTGQALLLDRLGNRVWAVEYSFNRMLGTGFTTPLIARRSIVVGNSPVGIALNEWRTRAYVLNQGDETISVLNLPTSTALPVHDRSATVYLQEFFRNRVDPALDKQVTIQPNGIMSWGFTDWGDSMLVSTVGLKGGISVPIHNPVTRGVLPEAYVSPHLIISPDVVARPPDTNPRFQQQEMPSAQNPSRNDLSPINPSNSPVNGPATQPVRGRGL